MLDLPGSDSPKQAALDAVVFAHVHSCSVVVRPLRLQVKGERHDARQDASRIVTPRSTAIHSLTHGADEVLVRKMRVAAEEATLQLQVVGKVRPPALLPHAAHSHANIPAS